MKLMKDICRRCHNENRVRRWEKQPKKDKTWARGRVACVAILDMQQKVRYIRVNQDPPYECYYRLEQLLKSQKKTSGFPAYRRNTGA